MVDQIEVPDGVHAIHLVGHDSGGDPYVVLVDTSGRLVAVIQGEISGITNNVTVEQDAKDREIQGADGPTLRTVAVDSSGQIIMVPRGQSGNYLDVDASGFLTTLIKGLDGATLRSIAVDGTGNLIAVIKGDDGGTLRTASLNADGRFEIVPYDPDDVWGNAIGMGNAELAAILSPVKRGDRRGQVVWWDAFEDGLAQWVTSTSGAGGSVDLASGHSVYGAYSCKLTGGSDASKFAGIDRMWRYPGSTKIGLSAKLAWGSNVDYIEIRLLPRDGTNAYIAAVRWVTSTTDFEYYDSGAGWTDIDASKGLLSDDRIFHYMKAVIDLDTKQYVRAFLDDEEYDISGNAFFSTASALQPRIASEVILHSDAGQNPVCYVDQVIQTYNEPA